MAPRRTIAVPEVRRMRNLRTPVDTFVQVKPQYSAEVYGDEAKSTKELKAALGVAINETNKQEKIWQQKQDKKDKASATREALLHQLTPGNIETQSAEYLHPDRSPLFQAVFNEKLGYNHSIRWQSNLKAEYEKEKASITSLPEWLSKKTQDYMNTLGDNPHFVAGAAPTIQQTSANLLSQHASFTRKRAQEQFQEEDKIQRANIFADETTTPSEKITNAWRILQTTIHTKQSGKDAETLRQEFFEDLIDFAEITGGDEGIKLLKTAMLLSNQNLFGRVEVIDGKIKTSPSGLNIQEQEKIETKIETIQEDARKEQLDKLRLEAAEEKAANETAEEKFFEYTSSKPIGYIFTPREIRAWVKEYEKDNPNVNAGKLNEELNKINNNARTSEINAANYAQNNNTPLTKLEIDANTVKARIEIDKRIRTNAILGETDIQRHIQEMLASNDYVGIDVKTLTTYAKGSLNDRSIMSKFTPFKNSTKGLLQTFKYNEIGDKSALGSIINNKYLHIVDSLNQLLINSEDGLITFDNKKYNIEEISDVRKLYNAAMKEALESSIDLNFELRKIAKGKEAYIAGEKGIKGEELWTSAFEGGTSPAAIYDVLERFEVVAPENKPTATDTTATDNKKKSIVIPEDLGNSRTKEDVEKWLQKEETKNNSNPVAMLVATDQANAMLEKLGLRNTGGTEDSTSTAVTPPVTKKVPTPTPTDPLNIETDVDNLMDTYSEESRKLIRGKSGRTGVPSISPYQISQFMEFLNKVRSRGLVELTDTYSGVHNKRKKTGTTPSEIKIDEEQIRNLFDRFFDLSVFGMQPAYFDDLFKPVSEALNTGET